MLPKLQYSEVASLQLQLQTIIDKFDRAIKSHLELSELKKIFHEIKKLHVRMDELNRIDPTLQILSFIDDEEFLIEFNFKGSLYTGIVSANEKSKTSTYVVRYSRKYLRKLEKTIKLSAIAGNETDPLDWEEVPKKTNQTEAEKGLIRVIGEALEDCESLQVWD
jgi:hypothetical protein